MNVRAESCPCTAGNGAKPSTDAESCGDGREWNDKPSTDGIFTTTRTPETLVLTGPGIVTVEVDGPSDEVLLMRLCWAA